MTNLELRQKIDQQLAQLPPDQLFLVSNFLDSLQHSKQSSHRRHLKPIKRRSQPRNLLKLAGKWEGNDLEDCLQFIQETRSEAQF